MSAFSPEALTHMRRCLELAARGEGSVSPNPMVGSVVVAEGRVVGEGWHEQYGGAHAEVNAIAAVGDDALLRRATLYVNLEPCSHWGKTPPCADLIVEKGIPRVVVACRDPHEKVAGRGIERMRAAGVEVLEGVLEEEALRLNRAFVKFHTTGLPFVTLKIAETLDGCIATADGRSKWITGDEARTEVHRMRCRHDAVLTGAATAIADGARLTVRHCAGRNPLRVVVATCAELDPALPVFDSQAPSLLFLPSSCPLGAEAAGLLEAGVEIARVEQADGGLNLRRVLEELARRQVLSVLVEGGSRLSAAFIRAGLVDRIAMFVAPRLFGGDALSSFAPLGIIDPNEAVQLEFDEVRRLGADLLVEARVLPV